MFLTEWVTLWMRYLIPGDSFVLKVKTLMVILTKLVWQKNY